jgi:phosphoglycerate dehydrogenase-like enzyme
VNVGRGSLVDEDALIAALQTGGLRGAGLDVTQVEPLPTSSPLWSDTRVVLTAHNAGDSPGFGPRWGEIFRQNLAAFVGRGAWRNAVTGPGAAR